MSAIKGWSLLCAAGALSVHAADTVAVEVMVESFCPCSGSWEAGFQDHIVAQIGELVTLTRFFDAAAAGTQGCCNPLANSSATCMHTTTECVADSLQRCVQEHYPDWRDWLAYTTCINGPCDDSPDLAGCKDQMQVGMTKALELEKTCAKKLSMDWEVINTCWTGAEGIKLMTQDAMKGDDMVTRYGRQGLPVVWIDGVLLTHFFECDVSQADYQQKFIQAVCSASTVTPLPAACTAVTSKMTE